MAVDLAMPILIVDDYNTMVRIIRNLLKQLGFQNIDDAPDGTMALQKLRRKSYGLVISDWNMQPMTATTCSRKCAPIRHSAKLRSSWSPPSPRPRT
jgi:PleD family two-component response regulator